MTAQIIKLSDLNTTVNHEPRIEDVRVGEALGFDRPRKVRDLIKANLAELESYGGVCPDSGQTSDKGGRPSVRYWLNEAQCILLCMFSRTEKAAEARKAIIQVFMDYRKGLVPVSDTVTPAQKHALQLAMKAKHDSTGTVYAALWGRFNNHFKLGSYKELPASRFEEAVSYIETMPTDAQLALPQPEKPGLDDMTIRNLQGLSITIMNVQSRIQGAKAMLNTNDMYNPENVARAAHLIDLASSQICESKYALQGIFAKLPESAQPTVHAVPTYYPVVSPR